MFSNKELNVIRMKIEGLMNKDIAKNLGVSEPDISQTLKRLREKVKTVRDSIELLTSLGMIKEGPKYALTEKGRALTRIPEKKIPIKPMSIEKIFTVSPSFVLIKKEGLTLQVYGEAAISESVIEYPLYHEIIEKAYRYSPLCLAVEKGR